MRIVPGVVLTAIAILAMSAPVTASDLASQAAADFPSTETKNANKGENSAGKWDAEAEVDVETQFYEGEFVYIPPPPPSPEQPLFYSDAFKYVPAGNGQRSGQLVRPVSGPIPVSSLGAQQLGGEKQGGADGAPAAAPTPMPALVSVPEPEVVETEDAGKQDADLSPAETADSVIFLQPDDDIEDPRFYHGSFVYDPDTQSLRPEPNPSAQLQNMNPSLVTSNGGVDSNPRIVTKNAPAPANGGSSAFPRRGRAMYYNPGVMDLVLATRLEMGQASPCPECVGYVALMRREDLNRKVWLEWEDGDVEGPFLVVDAAARQHIPSLLSRNWVVDVDYETAVRRGMNRPLPVTVWDTPHRTQKPRSADQDGLFFYGEAAYMR